MGCSSCGAENPPGFRFCGECGRPLAPDEPRPPPPDPRTYTPKHLADKILTTRSALEGERKQVTVLFADVKGSMDLAEQLDPEEWHRILDRFFHILTDGVHCFEGTVNQFMDGDPREDADAEAVRQRRIGASGYGRDSWSSCRSRKPSEVDARKTGSPAATTRACEVWQGGEVLRARRDAAGRERP